MEELLRVYSFDITILCCISIVLLVFVTIQWYRSYKEIKAQNIAIEQLTNDVTKYKTQACKSCSYNSSD